MKARAAAIAVNLLIGWHVAADATDVNIPVPAEALERQLATEPFSIVAAEISRPQLQGDVALKAEIDQVDRRRTKLLEAVDEGRVGLVGESRP